MVVKVFVLGLPGSGKTAATRCISMFAKDRGYKVKPFNDYAILHEWFDLDVSGTHFSKAANGGFDVHDYSILNTSLQELEKLVLQEPSSDKEIITIEFARNEYPDALSQFSASFLQDAYFLYLDAEIFACKKRTRERFIHASSIDDHYVSDYIFEAYYNKEHAFCMAQDINMLCDKDGKQYAVDAQRVAVIDNLDATSMEAFYTRIQQITQCIIDQKDIVTSNASQKHLLPTSPAKTL